MISAALCNAFLSQDCHDLIEHNRHRLDWAANRLAAVEHKAEPHGRLLDWILSYDKKYGRCPDAKQVLDFVTLLDNEGKNSVNRDECAAELQSMKEYAEGQGADLPTDVPSLIESTVRAAWEHFHGWLAGEYHARVYGKRDVKEGGSTRKATPADAIVWMRQMWATRDLRDFAPQPSGSLQDLSGDVEAEIERMASGEEDAERIKFGFAPLDREIHISKRRRPFIGIMGFANDGKTTVLLTMLYNMAMQGRSVCLFSKEHTASETGLYFAFLHSHSDFYRRQKNDLPSMKEFEDGLATREDKDFLIGIWRDMVSGKNFPGRVEIQPLTDWDSLVGHLTHNHKKNRYDVAGVDYLTRIDIPGGNIRFRKEDVKNTIGQAQRLTRDFDGGRGIVLISPIQINRAGYIAAKKKKEGEARHDMTSVSEYSEFYQDMDVLVSLFSNSEMRLKREILLETQKVRKSGVRPTATLWIDPRSDMVTDTPGMSTEAERWVREGTPMTNLTKDIMSCLDIAGGDEGKK